MKIVTVNNIQVFLQDITEEKIFYLQKRLERGWGFGMGEKIKPDVIKKAIEVYRYCKKFGFKADIVPILNGAINMLFYLNNNDQCLQVYISPSLSMDIELQKGYGQQYDIKSEKEDANFYDIKQSLNEIKGICNTPGYYHYNHTTPIIRDSPVVVSWVPQKMEEFPLLESTVLTPQLPTAYASTFSNSIQTSPTLP